VRLAFPKVGSSTFGTNFFFFHLEPLPLKLTFSCLSNQTNHNKTDTYYPYTYTSGTPVLYLFKKEN
ncbi:hypothetical protein AB4Z17_32170, partial [Paenibacillus sp. TAF43_2]|uniref:hypothetical protein n=1 Tax=Paenibacillus sp. TAF43_2 TaxID=3233069 RepID=UPI003F973910